MRIFRQAKQEKSIVCKSVLEFGDGSLEFGPRSLEI